MLESGGPDMFKNQGFRIFSLATTMVQLDGTFQFVMTTSTQVLMDKLG